MHSHSLHCALRRNCFYPTRNRAPLPYKIQLRKSTPRPPSLPCGVGPVDLLDYIRTTHSRNLSGVPNIVGDTPLSIFSSYPKNSSSSSLVGTTVAVDSWVLLDTMAMSADLMSSSVFPGNWLGYAENVFRGIQIKPRVSYMKPQYNRPWVPRS